MSKKVYIFPRRRLRRHRRPHSSRPSPPRRNRYQNCIHQRNQTDQTSHGITMLTDTTFAETDFADADMLVLGRNAGNQISCRIQTTYRPSDRFQQQRQKIAAICAAPSVFSGLGFLKNRKATSYPSFMEIIAGDGAKTSEDNVVVDGNITTSRGLGTAVDFALSLISQLENDEKAKEIAESVVYTR